MKSAKHLVTRLTRVPGPVSMKCLLLVGLLLTAFASGCRFDHDYTWQEYSIDPERVTLGDLPAGTAVDIVNGQADDESFDMGKVGAHHYHGSLSQLTDAVIEHLKLELGHRDVEVRAGAAKTLEVTVLNSESKTGMWMLRADMNVQAKTGDGYVLEVPISNRTPTTVPQAYNGAVALAVIRILNDSAIAEYLSQ